MTNVYPEISVIVPVYKAENYIICCIDSLLAQTFSDFELLLVEDGSPDCCAEICDEYAKKDWRIRVFHQRNSGVSVARNKGLDEARGKYVTFVDSDDWVEVDYLNDLYKALPNNNSRGLIIEGVKRIYPDKTVKELELPGNMQLDSVEAYRIMTELLDKNVGYSASKLYNLSLIREHQLCFSSAISLLEDLLFMYDYILHADYIKIQGVYHYFYRTAYTPDVLSVYIKSFQREYAAFCAYKKKIDIYQLFYKLQDTRLVKVRKSLKPCFHRCVLSLYLSSYTKKERKVCLRKLVEENRNWISEYFFPDYKIDKIARDLLLHAQYALFDIWMQLWLAVKCKYMFGQ